MKILIKNGLVIDGSGNKGYQADLLINNGVVEKIAEHLDIEFEAGGEDVKIVDAKGKIVAPGLIDIHVHLREPGQEAKETIYSGTRAAANGGFTAVACMPNTEPAVDNRATVEMVQAIAAREGVTKVYPIGAITKGRTGKELTEFGDLQAGGVKALSDDGDEIMRSDVMRRALEYSKAFDLPIICHCEDNDLAGNGVMNEGYWSTILGLAGIPALAEELMVARDIELARLTNARVHIAHISTKGSVELVRQAKKKGIKVTAEVGPHHLVLTEAAVANYDTNTKVNPPLRLKEDIDALIAGLVDGTVDAIATDHAPHTEEEKNQEYAYAPFGLVGLETALGLMISALVIPGHLTWEQLIEKMSVNPAKILALPGGKINLNSPADIVIINPDIKWTVDAQAFYSQGKNTPFQGWELQGKAEMTIVNGKVVMEEGKIL
ncbi:MAG: dihydroorotase [Bacillota bacterium]|nr:dihydroorotase [Bacillota bacterium]